MMMMMIFTVNTETKLDSSISLLNPLNPELNPICYLLALLAHHFLHVSRIRDKSLTLCGRSPAEIVGSTPTGGMDICLL
jgi:hypothetical protein